MAQASSPPASPLASAARCRAKETLRALSALPCRARSSCVRCERPVPPCTMFQCRMCSENPFVSLFMGSGARVEQERKKEVAEKKNNKGAPAARKAGSQRNEQNFHARSDEEQKNVMKQWEEYAHPRAREFFGNSEMLEEVLQQLAKGIDEKDDPVLGPDEKCVYWYGDVTKDDLQAAIRMVKPGEAAESVTYVNRVLAFIFATDDSFEALMKLPKEPFKMSCGDQLCVHLAHISLAV